MENKWAIEIWKEIHNSQRWLDIVHVPCYKKEKINSDVGIKGECQSCGIVIPKNTFFRLARVYLLYKRMNPNPLDFGYNLSEEFINLINKNKEWEDENLTLDGK